MKNFVSFLMIAGLVLALPAGQPYAQFFEKRSSLDEKKLDYEKIFKEGLSGNGRTLNLSGKKIGDEGLLLLLTRDFLKKVTKLDLRYNEISEKGAKALADSDKLGNLKKLELRHNYLLDNGVVALAGSKGLPKLEKLGLSFNEVRDQGGLALANTENFPKLRKLDLRGNFLADHTKQTLKQKLGHLKSLKLF
ncbi:MAG: hypothetical protein GWM98_20555 [Nitrospinaceae bacterium]|nr:hypothetical protein [Nitrospinaceae bacterium]NIR56423.1 hypothetical protein [Nitrospinaceae bacterium]NIS86887.1 hypothetical protein [Nitrospinaceae bacterium]NIT83723.1 hypothetical protein [Nitrospinaceae bacterium]NIU45924.1 hypothetical protein [Nitrospinaceae bacterium]